MPMDMKKMIAQTFARMAREGGVDKITVKALIGECGTSRQTFYYHFQDIVEVIEWSVEQENKRMLEQSLQARTPQEALAVIVASTMENRVLIRKLMNSQKREHIERLFVQATRTYLGELIHRGPGAGTVNLADLELALDLWSFGISGVLFLCCEKGEADPERVAAQIYRILSAQFLEAP